MMYCVSHSRGNTYTWRQGFCNHTTAGFVSLNPLRPPIVCAHKIVCVQIRLYRLFGGEGRRAQMSLLLPGECANARSTASDNQQNQYQQTPTRWQLTNKTRRQVTNNGFNKASDNQQNQYQRPGSQVTNKRWQIINKTNTKELEDREIFQNIFGKSVWSTMHILKECCSCILSFCLHFLTVDLKHKRLSWLQQ